MVNCVSVCHWEIIVLLTAQTAMKDGLTMTSVWNLFLRHNIILPASLLPSSRRVFLENSQILQKQLKGTDEVSLYSISVSVINVSSISLITHVNKGFRIKIQTEYYEHNVYNGQNKMLSFCFLLLSFVTFHWTDKRHVYKLTQKL